MESYSAATSVGDKSLNGLPIPRIVGHNPHRRPRPRQPQSHLPTLPPLSSVISQHAPYQLSPAYASPPPLPPSKRRREEHCTRQSLKSIDEREADLALQRRELELDRKCLEAEVDRRILSQAEDKLTCPLCLEIIACPYVLAPAHCGHSFCGECILKWYFSVLHDDCGCWHECVSCPTCRAVLPYTRPETPRPPALFPFAPNRALDRFLSELSALRSADTPRAAEWRARDAAGRTVMRELQAAWETISGDGFVAMKRRLGL